MKKQITGPKMNKNGLAAAGIVNPLVSNFTPSARGWTRPFSPTLFGPCRSWTIPKPFRSVTMKKATPTKIIIEVKKQDKTTENIIEEGKTLSLRLKLSAYFLPHQYTKFFSLKSNFRLPKNFTKPCMYPFWRLTPTNLR